MDSRVRTLLEDIKLSIESIDIHLQGKRNFLVYEKNITMQRSVERELEIIGEAMKRLLDIFPEIQITNKRGVINFRNKISHGYDVIDNVMIWGVVIKHLPLLKSEVEALLKQE
jgi:uncharacterized protein with HEPN domain